MPFSPRSPLSPPRWAQARSRRRAEVQSSVPVAHPLTRWYVPIAIASLSWILLYRLFPYDVSMARDFSPRFILRQFSEDGLSAFKDYFELLTSVFIFAAFSFGLTGWLQQRRLPAWATLLCVIPVGVGLSLLAEIAQAFLPSRNPNLADIWADSLGVLLGWFSFYRWRWQLWNLTTAYGQRWLDWWQRSVRLPGLLGAFGGYALVAIAALVLLPFPTDFSNWNFDYGLNIGNEASGNRPWQGTIQQLQLFDRAVGAADATQLLSNQPPQALVTRDRLAAYDFTQPQTQYADLTGQAPPLVWQGSPVSPEYNGLPLSPEHWLKSATAIAPQLHRMQTTTAFTLDATITPATLQQGGPARIISASVDPSHRNFTLGQDGANLVFRVRTPITGLNGSRPQMVVPNVFTNLGSHHVVVTYQTAELRIYIDRLDNVHVFKLPYLGYRVVYYGLMFVPLGILLSFILSHVRSSLVRRLVLILGIVVPPIALEVALSLSRDRAIAWDSLPLSLGLLVGALCLTRILQRQLSRQRRSQTWAENLA